MNTSQLLRNSFSVPYHHQRSRKDKRPQSSVERIFLWHRYVKNTMMLSLQNKRILRHLPSLLILQYLDQLRNKTNHCLLISGWNTKRVANRKFCDLWYLTLFDRPYLWFCICVFCCRLIGLPLFLGTCLFNFDV